MGKSGGILIIGIGVALLSLAYTGRAQAVYAAFTGSGASADATDATEAANDTEGQAAQEADARVEQRTAAGEALGAWFTGYGPIGVSDYVRV